MSDLITRRNAARVAFVGLFLLVVLVVLSSDAPLPTNAADGQATEAPAGVDGDDSAEQAGGGTAAQTLAATREPPLATGCFRSGYSRAEVRAVMGMPDTVIYGAWKYGRSSVSFGYGVVADYSNEGDNLRLC